MECGVERRLKIVAAGEVAYGGEPAHRTTYRKPGGALEDFFAGNFTLLRAVAGQMLRA